MSTLWVTMSILGVFSALEGHNEYIGVYLIL